MFEWLFSSPDKTKKEAEMLDKTVPAGQPIRALTPPVLHNRAGLPIPATKPKPEFVLPPATPRSSSAATQSPISHTYRLQRQLDEAVKQVDGAVNHSVALLPTVVSESVKTEHSRALADENTSDNVVQPQAGSYNAQLVSSGGGFEAITASTSTVSDALTETPTSAREIMSASPSGIEPNRQVPPVQAHRQTPPLLGKHKPISIGGRTQRMQQSVANQITQKNKPDEILTATVRKIPNNTNMTDTLPGYMNVQTPSFMVHSQLSPAASVRSTQSDMMDIMGVQTPSFVVHSYPSPAASTASALTDMLEVQTPNFIVHSYPSPAASTTSALTDMLEVQTPNFIVHSSVSPASVSASGTINNTDSSASSTIHVTPRNNQYQFVDPFFETAVHPIVLHINIHRLYTMITEMKPNGLIHWLYRIGEQQYSKGSVPNKLVDLYLSLEHTRFDASIPENRDVIVGWLQLLQDKHIRETLSEMSEPKTVWLQWYQTQIQVDTVSWVTTFSPEAHRVARTTRVNILRLLTHPRWMEVIRPQQPAAHFLFSKQACYNIGSSLFGVALSACWEHQILYNSSSIDISRIKALFEGLASAVSNPDCVLTTHFTCDRMVEVALNVCESNTLSRETVAVIAAETAISARSYLLLEKVLGLRHTVISQSIVERWLAVVLQKYQPHSPSSIEIDVVAIPGYSMQYNLSIDQMAHFLCTTIIQGTCAPAQPHPAALSPGTYTMLHHASLLVQRMATTVLADRAVGNVQHWDAIPHTMGDAYQSAWDGATPGIVNPNEHRLLSLHHPFPVDAQSSWLHQSYFPMLPNKKPLVLPWTLPESKLDVDVGLLTQLVPHAALSLYLQQLNQIGGGVVGNQGIAMQANTENWDNQTIGWWHIFLADPVLLSALHNFITHDLRRPFPPSVGSVVTMYSEEAYCAACASGLSVWQILCHPATIRVIASDPVLSLHSLERPQRINALLEAGVWGILDFQRYSFTDINIWNAVLGCTQPLYTIARMHQTMKTMALTEPEITSAVSSIIQHRVNGFADPIQHQQVELQHVLLVLCTYAVQTLDLLVAEQTIYECTQYWHTLYSGTTLTTPVWFVDTIDWLIRQFTPDHSNHTIDIILQLLSGLLQQYKYRIEPTAYASIVFACASAHTIQVLADCQLLPAIQ